MMMFMHPERFWRLLHFFTVCDVYSMSLLHSVSDVNGHAWAVLACRVSVCVGVIGGALCTCLAMIVTRQIWVS